MNCECTQQVSQWQCSAYLQPVSGELHPGIGIASNIMTIHATMLQKQIAQFLHSDTPVCPVFGGPQAPPATACSRNRSLPCRSYSFSCPDSDPRNRVAWTKSLHVLLSFLLLVRGVVDVPRHTGPEQTSNPVSHSHCVGQSFQVQFRIKRHCHEILRIAV